MIKKKKKKKLTKKEKYGMVLDYIKENEMLVEFITNEMELLSKKSARTAPTKTQVENEKIKEKIVATLVELDRYVTITEIQNANTELADLSNQKVSALLKQLYDNKMIEKMIDKKKAYFKASV